MEAARNRLSVLEGLAALDVSQRKMVPGGYSGGKDLATVASYVEGLADFGPDPYSRLRAFGLLRETTRPPYGSQIEVTPDSLDRLAWKAYLDGPVAAEIEKLRREIARLETAETEHFKTMATMVDYYVPG